MSLWLLLNLVILPFCCFISFKSHYNLESKSSLSLWIKLNFLLLKILFILRIRVTSILFLILLVILVIQTKWKGSWMNIAKKLKLKRYSAHSLLLIAGLIIIFLFDITKANIVSSHIFTSHLNSHDPFLILKNSNNLIE